MVCVLCWVPEEGAVAGSGQCPPAEGGSGCALGAAGFVCCWLKAAC